MLCNQKNLYYINISKEAQSKRWYNLSAQLHQLPERVKPYVVETAPDKVE